MRFCRETIWLMVAVIVLLPAGCASQRGRMASKHQLNTAQLLAAARQYEKEGNLQSATNIYRHVLQFHPTNSEAKQGLALVQQGKLRVDYDPQQLLASTDPSIQGNPQARQQLAKIRQVHREQVDERMAQLIAEAAQNPQKIEVDPTPTPMMLATISASAKPAAAPQATPARPAPQPQAPITQPQPATAVAQADAQTSSKTMDAIQTTGFARYRGDDVPEDWTDNGWQGHSLTDKCHDASAAVLNEVKKLESEVDGTRREGLTRLAQMGSEAVSAAPAIRRLLNDQNQIVVAHAAWAIWEVEGDAQTAVTCLQQSLSSRSTHVVQLASYMLGNLGEAARPVAPQLRMLLTDNDSFVRVHAAEALTRMCEGEERANATDTLVVLMKDADAGVRHLAAMTLAQSHTADAELAIAALTDALDDDDAGVRSAAALSLGAFGSGASSAVARLKSAATTDCTDVREAANTALACIDL